ncbi:MAG TPA: hypothetical protein VI007_01445, partial [bacterium]
EGCSSLFTYCTRVLRLSENAGYRRVEAARVVRAYPMVLDLLAEGSISLTTIRLLAPELTPANHRRLLDAAKHQPTRQVERLVAGLRPQPPVPSIIRQLPTRTASLAFAAPPNTTAACPGAAVAAADQAGSVLQPAVEMRPPAKPVVVPLTATRFKIQFTASEETHDLLRRAQDLLRHQIPDGNVGEVMAKALKVLVRELEKEKLATTNQPRRSRGADPHSRHIPAGVKRNVWVRDDGQCAFVAPNGRRCTERAFLEFHHVPPYSVGGDARVENIELRCRAHNRYEAELFFGPQGSLMVREANPAYVGNFDYSPLDRVRREEVGDSGCRGISQRDPDARVRGRRGGDGVAGEGVRLSRAGPVQRSHGVCRRPRGPHPPSERSRSDDPFRDRG